MERITYVGKPLLFSRDFDSLDDAEKWLSEQDCSVGRMQAEAPIGILRNASDHGFDIQKWRNLDDAQRKALDGIIILSGPRINRTARVLLAFAPSGVETYCEARVPFSEGDACGNPMPCAVHAEPIRE